jgi:hypothetical protein
VVPPCRVFVSASWLLSELHRTATRVLLNRCQWSQHPPDGPQEPPSIFAPRARMDAAEIRNESGAIRATLQSDKLTQPLPERE